jgi:hypothetical protein
MKRMMEMWDRYQAPAIRAANEAAKLRRAYWPKIDPHIRQTVTRALEAADYSRLLVIRSFTFARGGWHDAPLSSVPHGSLVQLADELADKPDHEVKAELDEVILAYFASNECQALLEMVDGWDIYPDWRQGVFEQAFWAHQNERYILSASTLAPQIEGMLRQETQEYGRNKAWLQKVNEAFEFQYDPNWFPSPEDLEAAVSELLAMNIPDCWQAADKISLRHALLRLNDLYRSGDFDDPDFLASTNRHTIVHGVADNFGQLESTKLFCAVELVHEVVGAYRATGTATQSDGGN